MLGITKKMVMIIDMRHMPSSFKTAVYDTGLYDHCGTHHFISEFAPDENSDFSKTFTKNGIFDYWQEQVKDNNYQGSIEEFIIEYNLQLDNWFINSDIDFTGVDTIYINI